MKKRMPVSTIMTKDLITLSHTDDLTTAEMLFKKHKIRHIPVVKGKEIIGMLSYTDLLRISYADAVYEDESDVDTMVYNMFTIQQVMAKSLEKVSPQATIKEVAGEENVVLVDIEEQLDELFEKHGNITPGYQLALAQTKEAISLCVALKSQLANQN